MTSGGEQGRAADTAASPAQPRSSWTASRVIGMVFASIGGLIGLALLAGGIAVLAAYFFDRDHGYFNSDSKQLKSAGYAITTKEIDLGADQIDWAPDQIVNKARLQVNSAKPVFVGIAPDQSVDRYLAGVAHDQLAD